VRFGVKSNGTHFDCGTAQGIHLDKEQNAWPTLARLVKQRMQNLSSIHPKVVSGNYNLGDFKVFHKNDMAALA